MDGIGVLSNENIYEVYIFFFQVFLKDFSVKLNGGHR